MSNDEMNEAMNQFYADMFNTFQNLSKIDVGVWEKAVRTQNDMFTLWTTFSRRQVEILTYVKDPQDLAEAERELSAEFMALSMELAKKSMGYMSEAMTDGIQQMIDGSDQALSMVTQATEAKPAKKPAKPRRRTRKAAAEQATPPAE